MKKFTKVVVLNLVLLNYSMVYSQQSGPEKWSAKVFPNPSNGVLQLNLNGKYDELTHVNILNLDGKSVYTENLFNDKTHVIDLSHVPSGYYTMNMMSTNVYMKQGIVIE